MKPLRLLCLFATCLLGSAFGSPARDEALQAIATLEKDVITEATFAAAGIIADFAQTSEDVHFTLGPDTAPWVTEEHDQNEFEDTTRGLLLAVYLAGNAKAQLARGQPGDDPYSGWVAVLAAYRRIQAKRTIVFPSLEHLAHLQQEGKLEQHARDVQQKNAAQPTTPVQSEPAAPITNSPQQVPAPAAGERATPPATPTPPLAPFVTTAPDPVPKVGHEDRELKIVFPGRLASCVFDRVHHFEPAALGYSVSYRPNTGAAGAITCYVYNKGLPSIPNGGGSDVVRAEMAEVVALIAPGWKGRNGVVEPIIPTADIRNKDQAEPIAQLAIHRITVDQTANISITVMAGYRNAFLKVRYTFPGRDPNTALRALTECWEAFARANPTASTDLLRSSPPAAATK